jgi:hypothetical protein
MVPHFNNAWQLKMRTTPSASRLAMFASSAMMSSYRVAILHRCVARTAHVTCRSGLGISASTRGVRNSLVDVVPITESEGQRRVLAYGSAVSLDGCNDYAQPRMAPHEVAVLTASGKHPGTPGHRLAGNATVASLIDHLRGRCIDAAVNGQRRCQSQAGRSTGILTTGFTKRSPALEASRRLPNARRW